MTSIPIRTSLSRAPKQPMTAEEMEDLRRCGWLVAVEQTLSVKMNDPRLAWDEKAILEAIGNRLYGKRKVK